MRRDVPPVDPSDLLQLALLPESGSEVLALCDKFRALLQHDLCVPRRTVTSSRDVLANQRDRCTGHAGDQGHPSVHSVSLGGPAGLLPSVDP